jgi:hypothetical protein
MQATPEQAAAHIAMTYDAPPDAEPHFTEPFFNPPPPLVKPGHAFRNNRLSDEAEEAMRGAAPSSPSYWNALDDE